MLKYCVASVRMWGDKPEVTFYACSPDQYGVHRVSNWNNENVTWYNTRGEALRARLNPNECVISRYFE